MNFHEAIQKLNDAHERAVMAMKHDYSVGTVLTYRMGSVQVVAEVTEIGYGLRLKVRGTNSGKEYWLDPRRITSVCASLSP